MAKRNSKRRAWKSADVRELKSAARNKTPPRKNRKKSQTQRGRDTAKGIQPRIVAQLARVKNISLPPWARTEPGNLRLRWTAWWACE